MMFVVVYLSAKLGQVSGRGLFHVLADRYPRWVLNAALIGVMIGNTIEAAADIGAIAAAVRLLVPARTGATLVAVAPTILVLPFLGSYPPIPNNFPFLALGFLAYCGAPHPPKTHP